MTKPASGLRTFFRELKRRKVFQVAVVYAVVGWLIIQVVETIFPRLHLPDWSITLVIVFVIIGFPIALIVAWALELTPEGVKRTEALEGKEAVKPSAAKPQPSIVVLPFDDISPGKENEYFSDGLTEEIITDLSYVHELRVISRNSAMTFKGTKKNTRTIAQELDVQYVLEGSVRKVANDLRITAQLIDATNDAHLWAEKYSGTLDDVFDIQEKVSRSIVDSLKVKLSPEEKKKIDHRPIEDVQAYECYLKAWYEVYRFKEDALDRAIQYLETGLDIVGENVLLYSSMGLMYCQYFNIGIKVEEEYLDKAEVFAEKVFELEPDSSYGHSILGFIAFFRGKQQESVLHLKKSYSINPNDSFTLFFLILAFFYCGKASDAEQVLKRLMEIDPLNQLYHTLSALVNYMKGRFDPALESSRQGYQMNPDIPPVKLYYAYFLGCHHQLERAYSVFDRLVHDSSETIFAPLGLFLKYALQGEKKRAVALITPEFRSKVRKDIEWSWLVADCYALIDEKKEALDWLEYVVSSGFINYPLLNEYDPFLKNIRGEKRFKKLMERVKYEWEHFEV